MIIAASRSDSKGYNIFRSYEVPNSAKIPELLREGPANPSKFKISSAFEVTGASKYFIPERKEQMESSGMVKFRDTEFPKPHNITELALDEMWAIYSTDVQFSVIVNIGPGLPNDDDVKQMAKRFSWGLDTTAYLRATPIELSGTSYEKSSNKASGSIAPPDDVKQDDNRVPFEFPDNTEKQDLTSTPIPDTKKKGSTGRTSTVGSIKGSSRDARLKKREKEMEQDIKSKLDGFYPSDSQLYYRLAPVNALQGTVRDDSDAASMTFNATTIILNDPRIRSSIDEVVKRLT